jgi:hypothetical protein
VPSLKADILSETITAESLEVAELETERLPLSDVSPHPSNARIHTPEQIEAIKRSVELDGYIAGSMCIQRSTRRLYKGHAVYEALSALGVHSADFVVKDLTDAETLALLARDNALSDMSTNDPVKLKAISVELQKMEVNIERMGYDMRQINAMQPVEVRSPGDYWEGMPGFEQEAVDVYQQIVVRFDSAGDVEAFAEAIGRTITSETKYLNFPKSNQYGYDKEVSYGN